MKWQDPKDRDEISVTRHSPKVHAWGGVGYHWKTDLYLFEQNLNGELYREILSQRIPPNFSLDCPVKKRGNWIFLQDNDPKHTAKKTQEYLNEIAPDRIRDFPPNSPDFNIQEDIWSHLQQAINRKKFPDVGTHKRVLQREWDNLSWEKIRLCYEYAISPRGVHQSGGSKNRLLRFALFLSCLFITIDRESELILGYG